MRVSRRVFAALLERALAGLPEAFAEHLDNLVVEIEDVPDAETCSEMELDDPRDLLGYYHGTPLTDRSVEQLAHLPDRIILYQGNIERLCRSRDELLEEIRCTLLHEIGHHFGLEEDDLEDVGYD